MKFFLIIINIAFSLASRPADAPSAIFVIINEEHSYDESICLNEPIYYNISLIDSYRYNWDQERNEYNYSKFFVNDTYCCKSSIDEEQSDIYSFCCYDIIDRPPTTVDKYTYQCQNGLQFQYQGSRRDCWVFKYDTEYTCEEYYSTPVHSEDPSSGEYFVINIMTIVLSIVLSMFMI